MKNISIHTNLLYFIFGFFILAGLLLVFVPNIKSLPEPTVIPSDGEEIGMDTGITISFPKEMNAGSVEIRIIIDPQQKMKMQWDGNSIRLTPETAYLPGKKISIQLESGATSVDGIEYKNSFGWTYFVRNPVIAYLGQVTTSPEIWTVKPESGEARKITQTDGQVTGFDHLSDRAGFLYTRKNSLGGADIHQVNMDGTEDQIRVNCGKEVCGDLTVSKDGKVFAFSRNRDPEDQTTSKKSYTYTALVKDISDEPVPVIPEKAISGILPTFSPNGTMISFYDSGSKGIRVLNKGGGNDFLLGTTRIQSGFWSSDGSKIAFIDDIPGHDGVSSKIYVIDTRSNVIEEPYKTFLGEEKELGEPDWSPDGKSLIVGIRDVDGPISRQLWLLNSEDGSARQITSDLSRMNAAPEWRADGKFVVFQQALLGQSGVKPFVVVWDAVEGTFSTMAEDASMPVWVP